MLHEVLGYLQQLFMAVVASCAPVIAYELLQNTKLKNSEAARAIVSTAITRATGVVINAAIAKGEPLIAHQMNVHPGLNYAINAAGPQLQKLGISDAELATKISSQLALTLHVPAAQPVLAATGANPPLPVAAPPISTDGKPPIPVSIVGQPYKRI